MSAAQAWFVAGTALAMAAGGLHVYYALVDLVRPTYFVPRDRSVKTAMEGTTIRLGYRYGGAERSMWRGWLGINIGFGIGILAFGLLCLLIAVQDFRFVEEIDAVRPLAIAFSAAFLTLSARFFFLVPVLVTGTATVCFTIATILSA